MRRIENIEKEMRGIVTYELSDGQRIDLDRYAVEKYGAEELIKASGYKHLLPTKRVTVMQSGRKVGTLPPTFDPMSAKSTSFWYDMRAGDFVREGDVWIANRMLGPGDLEAVPGFVWDRSEN